MASMKKVMLGALLFLIAFEFINCFPDLNVRLDPPPPVQIDFLPYFKCIGDQKSLCMPKGNHGLSPQELFDKKGKCLRDSHTACQSLYNQILADTEKNKACIGEQCIPQPTIQTEPKPEEIVNDVINKTEGIINDDQSNMNEIPERTLLVDSKELKRAEEGKCLTKGNVCRIPFRANNSSYLIEDCCEGQFCDQILKNNVEFGQCCLQNDRNNCWLPDAIPPSP